jgi:phosphoenolpyruvate-protein kinase (PTS system EI component)
MELYEDKPQNLVVLLRTAGFTVLAPIISLIKGIICTSGGTSSHLAIISREYRIPCIMAARLDHDDGLDEKRVRLLLRQQKGYVYLQEAQG